MKKLIYPFIGILFLAACAGEESDTTTENEGGSEETQNVEELENTIPIDITLSKIEEYPSAIEIKGNMVDAHTWNDKNGHNFFIRTISEIEMQYPVTDGMEMFDQYLYAYHYTENAAGELSMSREITDFVKDCEFDLIMGHEVDAITLTDLDNDDIAEITFIYRLACTSDVSPSTQKLIMLENGDKYALRGYTQVMGDGGDYEVGDEFNNAPDGFLDHAKELWSQNLAEYDFDL